MTDSVPANYNKKITITGNELLANSITSLDSNQVRKHLYKKFIEKNGPDAEQVVKERDMVFVPTQIRSRARATKSGNSFIISEILYEHRQNYSGGSRPDMVNTLTMKLE